MNKEEKPRLTFTEEFYNSLTLDELSETFEEAVLYHMKKAGKTKVLDSPKQVEQFTFFCVDAALKALGVNVAPGMDHRIADKILTDKRVRIETHRHHEGEKAWMNGIHIFKEDELCFCVCDGREVYKVRGIVLSHPKYKVITNAPI